ncbi:YfiR family protein [Pelomonas sp. CA6]|uniref:YfiR family protein n=1 Tax=Pelomonas sp. CA6 TaxID=2907999 RepID=UPI0024083F43|nr:YfiR family protein [Pelomonas sp. CA6]
MMARARRRELGRRTGRMRAARLCRGLLLAFLALALQPAVRAGGLMLVQSPLGTGAILQGILGYTAWPGASRGLRVCVSRGAAEATDIQRQLLQAPARDGRALSVQLIEPDAMPPAECDAVYFEGWSVEAQRLALRRLGAHPVLTLGRGPEFCSDGGMFCLRTTAEGTRFEVNLDSVSRSGLRVHPQVLRLARPAQERRS